MSDKPTLEELLGKVEAYRLREMGKAMEEALDVIFGGRTAEQATCHTCHGAQVNPEATLAPCCYCSEPTCFTCRDTGRHSHDDEHESINYGFCPPCGKVQPIMGDGKGAIRCEDCGFSWAPRAIIGVSERGYAICCFCGALQAYTVLPFHCGRCSMRLR